MLHLILVILKVIGFLLLAILILLLLGLLSLLFVPVRYEMSGKKTAGLLEGKVKVSWLFHLVGMAAEYKEKQLGIRLKLCGITIKRFGGAEEAGEKKREKKRKKKKKKSPDKKKSNEEKTGQRKLEEKRPEAEKTVDKISEAGKPAEKRLGDGKLEEKRAEDGKSEAGKPEDGKSEDGKSETGKSAEAVLAEKREGGWNAPVEDIISDKTASGCSENTNPFFRIWEAFRKLCHILALIWEFILSIPERIFAVWWKIQDILEAGGSRVDKIISTKEEISRRLSPFLQESSRRLYGRLLGHIKYLWTHYRPRKIRGWLRFGTGAPDLTGELIGLLYLWLPASADKFELIPDFTEAALEMDVLLKGRIRACHLVKVAFVLWRDKELRKLIRRVRAKGGK